MDDHGRNSQGSDDGTVVMYLKIAWNSKWEETLFHKDYVQWVSLFPRQNLS